MDWRGDIIKNVSEVPEVPGWCAGDLNGKRGWIPSNYIKPIAVEKKSTPPVQKHGSATDLRTLHGKFAQKEGRSRSASVQESGYTFSEKDIIESKQRKGSADAITAAPTAASAETTPQTGEPSLREAEPVIHQQVVMPDVDQSNTSPPGASEEQPALEHTEPMVKQVQPQVIEPVVKAYVAPAAEIPTADTSSTVQRSQSDDRILTSQPTPAPIDDLEIPAELPGIADVPLALSPKVPQHKTKVTHHPPHKTHHLKHKKKVKKKAKHVKTGVTHKQYKRSVTDPTAGNIKKLVMRKGVASMISSTFNIPAKTAVVKKKHVVKKHAVKKHAKAAVKKKKVVTKRTVYRAMYDYEANGEGMLSFKKGDVFTYCKEASAGWASAIPEGKTTPGWVPFAYIETTEVEDVKIVSYTEGEEPLPEVVLVPDATRTGTVLVNIFVEGSKVPKAVKMKYEDEFHQLYENVHKHVKTPEQEHYRLYITPAEEIRGTNRFIENEELKLQLSCFDLSEDSVYFMPEERMYAVHLPNKVDEKLKATAKSTAGEFLRAIMTNHTALRDNEFRIFTKADDQLEDDDIIWDKSFHETNLKLRMPDRQITIFVKGGKQFTMEVDYSAPLSSTLDFLCDKLGLQDGSDLVFTQLGGQGLQLKMEKSLYEQRVYYPASLLLKSKTEEDIVKKMEEKEAPVMEVKKKDFWSELETETGNVEYDENGHIYLASINKLVEGLTSVDTDNEFMQAFLLTHQSYITQLELVEKLEERFRVPKKYAEQKKQICLRVVIVLKNWIEGAYSDLPHEVISAIVNFIDSELIPNGHVLIAKKFRSLVLERMCSIKTTSKKRVAILSDAPAPRISRTKRYNTLFDYDEEEVARQITLYEFELFSNIKPSEFLDCAWSKDKLKHKSPNLTSYIQHTNVISTWVASLILEPLRVKVRAKRFNQLIKIMSHLRNLNNFNAVMAFISGFHSASIDRLKFTKSHLSNRNTSMLTSMNELMDATGSFKTFRDVLHNVNPPCLPYIGVYLTDLTFIEDGNPNEIRGLINFSKRRLLYKAIGEINLHQQTGYSLQSVPHLRGILTNIPEIEQKKLYDLSLDREPRGAKKAKL